MNTSTYESKIINILKNDKITFIREKTFPDLKGGLYRYDFFLVNIEKETIIEIDGEYHFKPIQGKQTLRAQQERDRRKNSYCLANNILLYRIPYWELPNIYSYNDILNNKFLVKTKWHNDYLIIPEN